MKTIKNVALEMYNNFELKEREDGSKYYATKEIIDWQRDIIFEAHLDRMPNDLIYRKIYDFLCVLVDSDYQDEDEALDLIYQNSEADSYTSDLTSWLNDSNYNVYYLTEAMEQGLTDGFQLLSAAQSIFYEEIGSALLNGILAYINANK